MCSLRTGYGGGGGSPTAWLGGAGGLGTEFVKPCSSCPPARRCVLVWVLPTVPVGLPHCLSGLEQHQPRGDRQTDRAGAQGLRLLAISSRLPLADPPLCFQACGGEQGSRSWTPSHYRVPGLEGTSVGTRYLGHSAVLSGKSESRPSRGRAALGYPPALCRVPCTRNRHRKGNCGPNVRTPAHTDVYVQRASTFGTYKAGHGLYQPGGPSHSACRCSPRIAGPTSRELSQAGPPYGQRKRMFWKSQMPVSGWELHVG